MDWYNLDLTQFIDKILGDFPSKSSDKPPKKSENRKNISEKSEQKSVQNENCLVNKNKKKRNSIDEEQDQSDSCLKPLWGVSCYGNLTSVNKKRFILRVACDLFAGHKWNSFLQLCHGLLINARIPGFILMKHFLFLLYRKPQIFSEKNYSFLEPFIVEFLFSLDERYEPLLELQIFLLNQNLLNIGKNLIKNLQNQVEERRMKCNKNLTIRPQLELLIETFKIYREYSDFLELKYNEESFKNIPVSVSIIKSKLKIRFQEILSNIKYKNYNYDIVALTLLELYENDQEFNEAFEMLQNYFAAFPDYLNSNIYLYRFLEQYEFDEGKRMKLNCLKNIVRLCPDSIYVLELIEEDPQLTGVSYLQYLEMLCNFLDYPSNRKSIRAWEMLLKILDKIDDENDLVKIKDYFNQKKLQYWQRIHFDFDLDELKKKINSLTGDDVIDTHLKIDKSSECCLKDIEFELFCKAQFLSKLHQFGCLDLQINEKLMYFKDLKINL